MPDHPDLPTPPTPPRRIPKTTGRRPRFALPADHHEERASERTTERIEAFLDGPARARRTRRRPPRPADAHRPRPAVPLETRTDWDRALQHEDARVARYGRPASVLVVEVALGSNGLVDRHATQVGTAIRAQARETDRIARVSPTRFHLLLPETDEREATALAERVARACRAVLPAANDPTSTVRSAVASPVSGGTLTEALRLAQGRLDG